MSGDSTIHERIDQIQKDAKDHAESDLKFFKEFTDQMKRIAETQATHLSEFKEFRGEMKPVKDAFDGSRWAGRAMVTVLKAVSIIIGVALSIKEIASWFKKS